MCWIRRPQRVPNTIQNLLVVARDRPHGIHSAREQNPMPHCQADETYARSADFSGRAIRTSE